MPRRAVTTLLSCLLCGAGCGRSEPAADPPAPAAPTPLAHLDDHESGIGGPGLNVLLVSVDTTRADHLGCYGHPEIRTPNIDRLAAEGTRFAWCISSAPLTLPSHTTMLTGSYPFVHGARDNGIFIVDDANETLAELVKAAGYATRAEVAAVVLSRQYGLDQGFDSYGDIDRRAPKVNFRDIDRNIDLEGNIQSDIELEKPQIETDRKADEITDRGLEILSELAGGETPFFVFLHYFDPHWPHEAPPRFTDLYDDGYYAEIAFFDEQFGRLLDGLDELGLADDTLVILTSDHGEGRGQHTEYTHSTFLYDTTLHVPLIMRCPGHVPAGEVVESQVRLVDLAPTIVDFLDLSRTPQMQGTTLLPLLAEPDLDTRLACYSDTLVPQNSLKYSPLRSLRTDEWKYILAPREELYRVSEDPLELFNLASAESRRAADMRQEMWDLIADSPSAPGGRGSWTVPDAEEVRKLAALGYVSSAALQDEDLMSGSELDHFEPVGVNPRDRVEVIESWATGLGAYRVGEYEMAARTFRRFVELEPDIAVGVSYLGRSLMQLKEYEEAVEMFRRAIELQPDNYIDHRMCGTALVILGRYDEAEESYRQALKFNPEGAVAHLNLGIVLGSKQQFEEALTHFEAGLALEPEAAPLHLQRGIALRAVGRTDEAAQEFREAMRLDPRQPRTYEQLAVISRDRGDLAEAIEWVEKGLEVAPEEPPLLHRRAELLAAAGDLAGAGESLARIVEIVPDNAVGRHHFGRNLLNRGRLDEAIEHLRKAVELRSSYDQARLDLARALDAAGRPDEAWQCYDELLAASPRLAIAYSNAADLLTRQGRPQEAIDLLRKGYAVLPEDVIIANELAWRLATVPDAALRNGEEAVRLAEYANSLKGGESCNELDTLAAAYAEVGRFDDAVETAQRALDLALTMGQPAMADDISARLALFRSRRPYRTP